jgi:hypothetical protein
MGNSNYLLRIPQGIPELTFDDLDAWLGRRSACAIGTTVVVHRTPEAITIELYGLVIAELYERPRRVTFPSADDAHLTTAAWITRIVRDNAIGTSVYRVRRHKADGPGPAVSRGQAGLLVIDGDRGKTVFGQTYPVAKARIEKMRRADAAWQRQWAAERERYAAESARREALKQYVHPVLGPVYAIDGNGQLDHGYHWQVVDSSLFGTLGYVRDTRVGPGDPWYQASPEPAEGGLAVFTAFAGGPEHRDSALGAFGTIADALAAIAGAVAASPEGANA